MNFAVAKANPALHAVFGTRDVDIRGRDVLELCDLSERDKLGKLRRELEEERNIRDPAYLPPIYSDSSELRAIEEVGDGSVGDVTHGSKDRPADIRFMIHGQPQLLPAQFNLAKTSVYFVVMVLSRYSPLQPQNVPPLFAQQGYGSTPPSMMMPSRGHITANRFISRGSSDPTFSRSFQGGALPGGASRGRSPPGAGQLAVDHVVGEQYQHHRTSPSVSSAPSYHSTQSPPGSEAAMLRRADLSHEGQNPGYPRDLQLAPMRGSAGTSPVETYPSSRESLGRTGESTGRTRRKRERVSVEEMLE
ncbi:MAG: hypothetical protein M1832_005281 [Thelocarpon impressellum]|nr:MAG: hypothetical protein M1832_005281 [Thelocarpon impressellum]